MLTVLCGLPASGKTTWRSVHAGDAIIVCLDDIREELTGDAGCQEHNERVMGLAIERVQDALAEGAAALVDATNTTRERRMTWLQLADEAGVPARCVFFPVLLATALERNRERERKVPFDVMLGMANRLEEPRASEGFDSVLTMDDADRCEPGAGHVAAGS